MSAAQANVTVFYHCFQMEARLTQSLRSRYDEFMRSLSWLIVLFLIGGCSYVYDVTRPPDVAGHVGDKTDYVFDRDPLEYRMRSVDSLLVVQIFNPTDDTITLNGSQSSVVDPKGQSHPLRTQTMASHSYIKFILPPQPPYIQQNNGPTIGIGIGVIGSRTHPHVINDDFYDQEPRYLVVVDDQALYWQWDGETEVRLLLAFDRNGKSFSHEFVIARKKK
jgi:hypothetical protein